MTDHDLATARVRRALDTGADRFAPTPPSLDRTLRRSRTLVRRRRAGVAGASLLVGAVVVALTLSRSDHGADRRPAPAAPTGPVVSAMPTSPLSARAFTSTTWTPEGLFVWGGEGAPTGASLDDGAVYDPAAREWRTVAASPLSPRGNAPAVWTGDGVLVAGGYATEPYRLYSDAGLYDPHTDRWTPVPDVPTCPTRLVALPGEVIALGGCGRHGADTARWDAATNTWAAVSDFGSGAIKSAYAWRGRVVAVDGDGHVRSLHGSTWTDVTTLPSIPTDGWHFAATATGLYEVAFEIDQRTDDQPGVLYRFDDGTWREVARGDDLAPSDFAASVPVAAGRGLVWPTSFGLCRWDGVAASCVSDPDDVGLGRFKVTYVLDDAETLYLWGGDYAVESGSDHDGSYTSSTQADGLTITWP